MTTNVLESPVNAYPGSLSLEYAEHIASILEAVGDGVTVQDASGAMVYANSAAAKLLGFASPRAMLDADPGNLVDLPGRPVLGAEEAPETLVQFRAGPDGGEQWAWVTARTVPAADGTPLLVLNTFREATAAVEASRRLAASEQSYRVLAEVLPSQVWTAGAGGALEYVNRRALDYFGRTFDEMIGSGWLSVLHPDDVARCVERWSHSLTTGDDYEIELRLRRASDATFRWHVFRAEAVRNAEGDISQWIGTNIDTDDARRLADERATEHLRADEALHAADEARSSLAIEQAARAEAEQARLRTERILAGITDSFAVCDPDGHVLFANEATTRQLGISPSEAVGKKLEDLLPDVSSTGLYDDLQRARAAGTPVTVEHHYPPLDAWVELRAYPLGEIGLAVHARDVTFRKREEQLRARLARYADLRADVMSAFAHDGDLASMLQACCDAVVRQLGVSSARIWLPAASQGEAQWLDLVASSGEYTHKDAAHARARIGEQTIGRIASERRAHLTNDIKNDPLTTDHEWTGQEGTLAFAGYPLVAGDTLLGVLSVFAQFAIPEDTLNGLGDIGEAMAQGIFRRRSEIELEEHARELARSNADLEQFAYVASHDLQEPLRMIVSYNQLLARRYKGKLGQDADDFIAFSVEGATRMQRVINDLLAYSRVGTRRKDFESVDMQRAFNTTKVNLRQAIEDEGAIVTSDALPQLVGDEVQLVQLLQNLIANGIKFHGPDLPRIHVGVCKEEGAWLFWVEDNGLGIDPRYFERIFVIFQRLHSRDDYPGTGIGLAICKKVVERHGGELWIVSEPGKGSTFFFRLPFSPPSPRRTLE